MKRLIVTLKIPVMGIHYCDFLWGILLGKSYWDILWGYLMGLSYWAFKLAGLGWAWKAGLDWAVLGWSGLAWSGLGCPGMSWAFKVQLKIPIRYPHKKSLLETPIRNPHNESPQLEFS